MTSFGKSAQPLEYCAFSDVSSFKGQEIFILAVDIKAPIHCFSCLGARKEKHSSQHLIWQKQSPIFFFYLGARRTRLISTSGQPGAREKRPKRIKSTPAMNWIVTISEFRALRFWKCFVNLYFAPGRQLYIFSEATKRTTCHSVVMCLLAIKRLGNVIVSSVLSLWH